VASPPNGNAIAYDSKTDLEGPASGCMWIYLNCGVMDSYNANGVWNFCAASGDFTGIDVTTLTGTIPGTTKLSQNVSGVRVGRHTQASLFRDLAQSSTHGVLKDFDSNRVYNLCYSLNKDSFGKWNDQAQSFSLSVRPNDSEASTSNSASDNSQESGSNTYYLEDSSSSSSN
jgi:hypothetical protein